MRWDEQRVENDLRLPGVGDGTVVRTFDAPEAMGINFHEVRARSALNRVPGGRYGFGWTINAYRGCTHACVYCFARRTHTYLDLNAGRDFEREIVVKVNVPELLRAELARSSWKRELVALGTNTDPYQWVESRYRMMPEILAALEAAETPVSVLTKSPLLLQDIEIYERMAKHLPVSVNLSVPTLDEEAWRATEPHTPSPSARLDAVAELRSRGIDSGVLIAPLMPGINDDPEQVQPIVDRAKEAGATFLSAAGPARRRGRGVIGGPVRRGAAGPAFDGTRAAADRRRRSPGADVPPVTRCRRRRLTRWRATPVAGRPAGRPLLGAGRPLLGVGAAGAGRDG
ncbi:MAG TPA: radical SAM protein, partial [Solirubrobacterales bacterium]|nr:radical SAM protein [Solirubrobacterales bacterium]